MHLLCGVRGALTANAVCRAILNLGIDFLQAPIGISNMSLVFCFFFVFFLTIFAFIMNNITIHTILPN